MNNSAPSPTRCISLRTILLVNALALGIVGSVGTILILMFHRTAWAAVWMFLGLLADEVLLYWLLRQRRASTEQLEDLTSSLLATLDAQARAISEQQRQIAGLQARMADEPIRRQVSGMLSRHAKPNLASLVDRLEEAEASLPDMLPQTRAWVSEVRRLATRAQAHVQALSDEVAWR
jgi:hypothetical protein